MSLRLSIRRKGLLIVAVPLIFQFVFVGLLMRELERSEAETLEETHAREVISALDRLFVHAYEASGALYIYAYTQNDLTSKKFDSAIKDIKAELLFLKKYSRPGDKLFPYLSKEMETGIMSLKDQKRMIDEDQHVGSNVERLTGYLRVTKLVNTARALAGVEFTPHGRTKRTFEERRDAIRNLVLLGLIGNVVMAFFIASFFGKSIEQRLKRVLKNLELFGKKEPLLPPMVVTDEIGVLDQAFHGMANNLRKAERVKQDFVAMIGHDIRTPATTIKTTLDLLDYESLGKLDDDVRQLVSDATGESRRLMTLTNNLLDLSQIEIGQFHVNARSMELSDAIQQSVRSLSLFAQSKSTAIKFGTDSFLVHADYDRLLQVLINLLSNAVKYCPKKSTIEIKTRSVDGFVEVTIEDNGPGIPEASREKIFQEYERLGESVDEQQRGMGLGLAICKSIVTAHGGSIGVRESAGGGSAFWFTLPLESGTN